MEQQFSRHEVYQATKVSNPERWERYEVSSPTALAYCLESFQDLAQEGNLLEYRGFPELRRQSWGWEELSDLYEGQNAREKGAAQGETLRGRQSLVICICTSGSYPKPGEEPPERIRHHSTHTGAREVPVFPPAARLMFHEAPGEVNNSLASIVGSN